MDACLIISQLRNGNEEAYLELLLENQQAVVVVVDLLCAQKGQSEEAVTDTRFVYSEIRRRTAAINTKSTSYLINCDRYHSIAKNMIPFLLHQITVQLFTEYT